MDEQLTEGNPVADGGSSANSTPSQSQSQPSGANFADEIAKLQKKIDAQEGEIRALKSGKDAAVDRAIKSQETTLAKLAKYLNVDEGQLREAQRQSVLDDLISERLSGGQSASPIQGRVEEQDKSAGLRTVEAFSVADAIAEIERYNLDVNEASVINLLRDKQLSKEKVKDHILGRVAPQKPPNPADVVQSPIRSGATEKSAAQLEQEYQKEAQQIVQTMRGDQKIRAIAELKEKYRGMGLSK